MAPSSTVATQSESGAHSETSDRASFESHRSAGSIATDTSAGTGTSADRNTILAYRQRIDTTKYFHYSCICEHHV